MRKTTLRQLLASGVAAGALSLALGAAAQAEQVTFDFDQPAMPMSAALQSVGRETGVNILVDAGLVKNVQANGLRGQLSADEALLALLDGTGLTIRKTDRNSIMIVSASDPQSGSAAGDGADGTVQALIVTAQKREEDIQDVPIAISAFTQEDLTRSQVAGGPDLMTQVPNFTFTKTNFTGYSIQIRGIGTQAISATTDAAVAVAFNNTPFIRNRFFEQEFYDLQRVEVLRGPQGTLYGRNATAGVVNLISAKPTFRYEARASLDVSNYNSHRLEGMINLPLVEDKVALRLAGAWTKRDGYDTNQLTGNQIDGRDLWSTRLSLRVQPIDSLQANLIWEHFEENDDRLRSGKQLCHRDFRPIIGGYVNPPINGYSAVFNQGCLAASLYGPESYQAPNGYSLPYYLPLSGIFLPVQTGMDPYASTVQSPNLRVIESTVDPKYSAKTDVAELQFSLDLPHNLTVTSETGYSTDELFSLEDYNRFNTVPGAFNQEWWDVTIGGEPAFSNIYRHNLLNDGVFCDPQIGCTSRVVAVDTSTAASHQFSQEFRLSSSFEGAFNFSLGANFLRYDTVDKYYVFINTLTLMAAISPYGRNFALPDYEPNASDNLECMHTGIVPPDFTKVQELAYCTYIDPNPVGSLNDMGHNYFLSKNPYKLISYAVFGEAYYNITPNLKVTAGLRWTVDKKEAPRIPSWILASDSVGYPVLEVVHQTWREPTGRLTIDWKPDLSFTDETLLYASYAHGYKAGGANPPPTGIVMYCGECGANATASTGAIRESAAKPKIFNPEYVDAFELGSKNTLLDGRMTLNATVFYYDYRGYQISQIIDRSAVNYNFDSKVWGAEIEADWRPLENLRLGFKGGYERTRIANGMKAIDIMDRTAGHDDWVVVRPFPTFASNCILPLNTVVQDGTLRTGPNVFYNGNPGPCEFTYIMNLDPVTALPYVPDPTERDPSFGWLYPGYHGFNPETAPNHGEGFDKDLSGHELPNAPHFTATITGDYTVPLPNDWLVTLHTDLYYQSEAWTRVFNTPGYDKLKAYTNVNLAAIFSNEERGWQVMAYIKNVLDKDNITGAFLNSDDTGLTTNVFLNEPRLYGLRVTKNWTGAEWWGGGRTHAAGQPYTFTVELGGQVQRQDAPYAPLSPSFAGAFSSTLNALNRAQNRDLDWGDGREVRVTYRPGASGWSVSAGVRYGRTNSDTARLHLSELAGDKKCGVPYSGYFETFAHLLCDPDYVKYPKPAGYYYEPLALKTGTNWSDTSARGHEEHTMADFAVGRDFGLGSLGRSEVTAGVRYADFKSDSTITFAGVPDYYLPVGWALYPSTRHRYNSSLAAERQFKGAGPAISVEGATPLIGNAQSGHVNLAWDVGAGVLFGRQKADIAGFESVNYNAGKYGQMSPTPADRTPVAFHRTKSVSVPVLDLSLGLSYEIERVKVGAGYRWERYYNAIDGGFAEHKSYDRTLDGPYFKVAVGFGG